MNTQTHKAASGSFLGWAVVMVPLVVALGMISGWLANSGYDNGWFLAIERPDIIPPGWVFGVVWTILYIMIGVSLAMILAAKDAPGRGRALALFMAQLVLNLAWSPLFFAWHQVTIAFYIILLILALTIATSFAVAPIRKAAAWLLFPYMVWLSFASILNYQIDQLNPNAETLVSAAARPQIGG